MKTCFIIRHSGQQARLAETLLNVPFNGLQRLGLTRAALLRDELATVSRACCKQIRESEMARLSVAAACLLCAFTSSARAQTVLKTERCLSGSVIQDRLLEKEYVAGDFHLFYSLQGNDRLHHTGDSNGNGTPDSIENMAIQLQAAQRFYSGALGLRSPLRQKVFANAGQINIYVLRKDRGKGAAFDKVSRERMADGTTLPCALKLIVDTSVNPLRNVTPAHELFHLYQYGYGVFKQRWYLEGMARWLEMPYRDSSKGMAAAAPSLNCPDYANASYDAAIFWHRYAQRYFAPVDVPAGLRQLTYTDGSPVFKQSALPGGAMLAPFFDSLFRASQQISQQQQVANTQWTDKMQRSPQFSQDICDVLSAITPQRGAAAR